jgi:hypothetical protein
MLSKEAQKEWNIRFWNGFKNEMKSFSSSNGKRINWLTYPTDVKNVYLRMVCGKDFVAVNFDIQFNDQGIRDIVWEQMEELKGLINTQMNYPSEWNRGIQTKEGLIIDQISWKLENTNYLHEDSWGNIYDFLKNRIISFDKFHQEFKDILINLVD